MDSWGAKTGRCSHYDYNVASIPGKGKEFGEEIRSLFCAPSGKVIVGMDVKNLELRLLAHHMNDEEYINHIVNKLALTLLPSNTSFFNGYG